VRKTTIIISSILLSIVIFIGYLFISDEPSKTVVEAIEKQRGLGSVDYIMQQHPVSQGEVIFYLSNINDDQIVVSTEYVRKTWRGWKWIYGGGHSGSNIQLNSKLPSRNGFSYQYIRSTEGTEIGSSPFPMIYGVILDPDITRIVVKDYMSGLDRQAKIIEIKDRFKLYYSFLDEPQGKKFEIIGYSQEGTKIETGLFGAYPQLEDYWKEENIRDNGKYFRY
jgi:hypothetical protein